MHRIVDGAAGQRAADYLERHGPHAAARLGRLVRLPPGRHPIARHHRSGRSLAGLKIRTIQSPIYVKAVELMGASPTPMAFGEVYTSLQTGVIDGYEHDASTTLQQRFYEVAGFLTRTRHIAGVLGLCVVDDDAWRSCPPTSAPSLAAAALEASAAQRARGPHRGRVGDARRCANAA